MARYKQLVVKKINLEELKPAPRVRPLSPRRLAAIERDNELRTALNEAAAMPSTEAIVIELRDGQKMPTLRAAMDRITRAEPRNINWGVRGTNIVISKGEIPGGRGARRRNPALS